MPRGSVWPPLVARPTYQGSDPGRVEEGRRGRLLADAAVVRLHRIGMTGTAGSLECVSSPASIFLVSAWLARATRTCSSSPSRIWPVDAADRRAPARAAFPISQQPSPH